MKLDYSNKPEEATVNTVPRWLLVGVCAALMAWASVNVGIMTWQMALSVWVANVQAPQALQQAQQAAQKAQQELAAERAKNAAPAAKP